MPKNKKEPLKDLYSNATEMPRQLRQRVLNSLNLRTTQSFYDIINGTRSLSDAEKKSIAEIFGKKVTQIRWPEPSPVIE